MTLYFKVGIMPGEHFHVMRRKKPPVVGETFEIRRLKSGCKPIRVHLTEIRHRGEMGPWLNDIYVVELM